MLERMKDLAKEGITMMAVANAMSLSIGRLPCADGKKLPFLHGISQKLQIARDLGSSQEKHIWIHIAQFIQRISETYLWDLTTTFLHFCEFG